MTDVLGAVRGLRSARSFRDRVGLAMLTNIVVAALGLVTGLLSARILGPQGRGELAAIQSWPTILAGTAMLGLDTSVVYWTSRNPQHGGRYLASAIALIAAVSSVLVVAGWILMPSLLRAQSPEIVAGARVFLLMVPIYALIGIPHQMLRATGSWRVWNAFRSVPAVSWLISLLVARYLVQTWTTPNALSVLYLCGYLWLIVPVLTLVLRRIHGAVEVRRSAFQPLLEYGLPDMLTILPRMLNQRLDQLLMAAFLDSRTLGLYVVAVAWSGAATPLLSAVGPVLFPTLSASFDAAEQRRRLARVLRITVFGATGLTIVVFALTPLVLPLLFGRAYAAAVPVAMILVVASGISGINLTLADGLRGLGHPRRILVSEVIGLVVTGTLLAILLPRYGALGAAITSLVAYLVVSCALIAAIRRS